MRVAKFSNDNNIVTLPFDKGTGFCVMKKQSFHKKLADALDFTQFQEIASAGGKHCLKIEWYNNNALLDMKKSSLLSKKYYPKLRSTEAEPARFYGLAKEHKNGIRLRPVLSIPGSSYYNLNKFLSQLVNKVSANMKTSTLNARKKLESIILVPDESIVSLDVKCLYTNVPVNETIEIALRRLHSSDHVPEISRLTLKTILS